MDIRVLFAVVAMAVTPQACADVFLDMGGTSHHFDNRRDAVPAHSEISFHREDGSIGVMTEYPDIPAVRYNESNPGIGVRFERGERYRQVVMGGMYLNSLATTSYYVSGGMKVRLMGNAEMYLDAGVLVGIATGYGPDVIPLALPTISFGMGHVAVTLMASPQVKESPATIMLMSSLRLR